MKAKATATRHPYAAIEHRVIDSPAYADLSFSARALLLLLARQLTKDNNGSLHASYKWCQPYGFGSEHTLRDAIAELIAHGFIYRTRSHGANGAWAKYAVTWLPIKIRDGLFLNSFEACAWRTWEPSHKKSSRQKVQDQSSRKCSFTPENPAESAGNPPAKSADNELIPCRGDFAAGVGAALKTKKAARAAGFWITAELARLAEVGLAGRQCFAIPPGRTLQ
jgi:hypothetical protein